MKTRIREGHTADGNWIRVPLAQIQTPHPGDIVHGPAYWLVTDQDEVLFYKTYHSPQCNASEAVVKRILFNWSKQPENPVSFTCPPLKEIRLIQVSFIPHECE
jgi:hypothetical protein